MKKITSKSVSSWIHKRDPKTYKNMCGSVLIIAGNKVYGGAAIMSAQGAVYSGAGLTTLASDAVNRSSLHARLPECMFFDYHDIDFLLEKLPEFDSILIGPGLGLDQNAQKLMEIVLKSVTEKQILIIDGDGITLYARGNLPKPKSALIFTPHAGEWKRLCKLAPSADTNEKIRDQIGATIVLKSHQTKIYTEEEVWQNIYGSPAMATGGTGDTLAGIIISLVNQTDTWIFGVLAGVFFHSYIGDILAKKKFVIRPTEIAELMPTYLKLFSERENY